VQERLKHFVNGGQLGIFTNGYWGHPAMKLSPEVNLMAVAHYLQALEVQRKANKIVSILGSKTPHIQNVAVGGVANPLATDSQSVLTVERLMAIKGWIDELSDFVKNVYLIDVAASAPSMPTGPRSAGITNYLSRAGHSARHQGHPVRLARRLHRGRRPGKFKPITTFGDEYFTKGVEESVKHSWYDYKGAARCTPTGRDHAQLHRLQGRRQVLLAQVADLLRQADAQVGPLAARAEHAGRRPRADQEVRHRRARHRLGAGQDQGRARRHALHHRPPRRARHFLRVQVDDAGKQWICCWPTWARAIQDLQPSRSSPRASMGVGFHEAPRGVLSHWVVIDNGKIKNYQCVVPSTWNACPRNEKDEPGAYEASLLDNPMADPEKPLEVLRTVHSFDPCIACAIHLTDKESNTAISVKAV
jgi:hydrogenase large subunit